MAVEENKKQCPQFPFFGATYPDACCIDGFLWDLDSSEGEFLTSGGEQLCPFCNQEAFIESQLDGVDNDDDTKEHITRESILKWISAIEERYGGK